MTDSETQNAVSITLNTLAKVLRMALEVTIQACDDMAHGEQNAAIGGLDGLDYWLNDAQAFYRAARAIHRYDREERNRKRSS